MGRYFFLPSLLLSLFLAPALCAQTSARAVEREIRAVRAMRSEVEKAVRGGKLGRRDTTLECPGAPLSFKTSVYTDRGGRVRRLVLDGGTSDQAATTYYLYDREGHLRHAIARRGAVNGTHEEEEVFYRVDGSILRQKQRRLEGPGYPFAPISPITHPADFARDPCN